MSGQKVARRRWTRWVLPAMLVLALAGAGMGYVYLNKAASASAQAEGTGVKTSLVRRGSIVISASGSGLLVPGQTAELSFPTAGKVAEVNVQVGDMVEAGQTLANLDAISSLQAAVTSAELNLKLAEQAAADLKTNAASTLANAQIALADAQEAYKDAKNHVREKGWQRCDSQTTESYYQIYQEQQAHLEQLTAKYEDDYDYYVAYIVPMQSDVAEAYAAYTYCLQYTDYEVATSHSNLTLAEETLKAAQTRLDSLTANNGIDPTEQARAESAVVEAKMALDKAEQNLQGAVMTAPFAGTVLSVAGEAGSQAGTATFITLIDLAHPRVEFSVDETDMALAVPGAEVEVVFDALPDLLFKGTILRMNPSLVSTQGYQVLQGVIQLELDDTNANARLLEGLNASVEIIGGRAENVLVVPVEAVRDIGGQSAVFVMDASGSPRLKVVETGLTDGTFTEIKSGVQQGDTVTTGAVETGQ